MLYCRLSYDHQYCQLLGVCHKVWKFHHFSITQILREINFRVSKSAKSAIFTHLEALNFDLYEFLHFSDAEIYQINKIQNPQNGQNDSFKSFRFSKIDFTQNLSDRFPHFVTSTHFKDRRMQSI